MVIMNYDADATEARIVACHSTTPLPYPRSNSPWINSVWCFRNDSPHSPHSTNSALCHLATLPPLAFTTSTTSRANHPPPITCPSPSIPFPILITFSPASSSIKAKISWKQGSEPTPTGCAPHQMQQSPVSKPPHLIRLSPRLSSFRTAAFTNPSSPSTNTPVLPERPYSQSPCPSSPEAPPLPLTSTPLKPNSQVKNPEKTLASSPIDAPPGKNGVLMDLRSLAQNSNLSPPPPLVHKHLAFQLWRNSATPPTCKWTEYGRAPQSSFQKMHPPLPPL